MYKSIPIVVILVAVPLVVLVLYGLARLLFRTDQGKWQFSLRMLLTLLTALSILFAAIRLGGAPGLVVYCFLLAGILLTIGARQRQRRCLIGGAVALSCGVLLTAMGLRHEDRSPSQSLDKYQAVFQIDRWSLFATEIYAHDVLGVASNDTRSSSGQWENRRETLRILGRVVRTDGDQFNLGDPDSSRWNEDACLAYVLRTKFASSDPKDRLWSVQHNWSVKYPERTADLQTALKDPDPQVQEAARRQLAHDEN